MTKINFLFLNNFGGGSSTGTTNGTGGNNGGGSGNTLTDIASHPTLTNGLVAYYQLEEATSDFLDSIGTNNLTRSTNGTSQATGKINSSLETTRGQLGKAFNPSFNPFFDTDWSVSIWFNLKSDGSTSNNQTIVGLTRIGATSGVVLRFMSPTVFRTTISSQNIDTTIPSAIALNTWYYLTVTFDKTSFETKVYFDGTLIDTQTGQTIPNITDRGFGIGVQDHVNPETNRHSDAFFDEAAIYNRVLTAQEVSDLYNNGNGLPFGGI